MLKRIMFKTFGFIKTKEKRGYFTITTYWYPHEYIKTYGLKQFIKRKVEAW